MNFSNALALMDSGFRCTRQEWKAKGDDVWVGMVRASQPITIYNMPKAWLESGKDNSRVVFGDWLGVKTATDVFIPWEAAQSDVFADDWTVYDLTIGDLAPNKNTSGAETSPKTIVTEISEPVNNVPQLVKSDAAPNNQVPTEVVNSDVYADATKFVNNKLNDTRAKRQRDKEKAAMRARVQAATSNSTPVIKPAPTKKSRVETEKAAMRARMNKALTKR